MVTVGSVQKCVPKTEPKAWTVQYESSIVTLLVCILHYYATIIQLIINWLI